GLLEARHVRSLLREQERLDRDVLLDVGVGQEHPDLATGRLLHHAREALGHLLLEAAADLLDRLTFPALGERLLRTRERLLQHHDDQVVDDVGLRPGGTLAVVLGLQAHHLARDRGPHLSQRWLRLVVHCPRLPEIAPLDTARFYLRRRCPFSVP